MNDRILDWANRIRDIAITGLAYCRDDFDRERYENLIRIAADMTSYRSGEPADRLADLYLSQYGYPTPKADTRAAIINDGRILLVHEKNGKWSLPGGWCDDDMSVRTNTEKEAAEETGLTVRAERIIAIHDWRKHNVCNYAFGVIKFFVLCRLVGGEFAENIETDGIGWFGREDLPDGIATEKNTKEQILLCFDAAKDENRPIDFD